MVPQQGSFQVFASPSLKIFFFFSSTKKKYPPGKCDPFTCCQAASAVFTQSCGTKVKRFLGYHHQNYTTFDYKVFGFFCIPGFTAETETTLLHLLHSSLFFPPLWHFDIPLVAWRSWALCLVLPRSGTEQQYAWAFSLHPPHPPPSSQL